MAGGMAAFESFEAQDWSFEAQDWSLEARDRADTALQELLITDRVDAGTLDHQHNRLLKRAWTMHHAPRYGIAAMRV